MKQTKTREIFKNFLINPQVKFEYPVTAIATPTKSMIVLVDLQKSGELEEDFKEPFGIIKTDVLLNVIDLFNDPEIDLTGSDIVIKSEKSKQKIRKSPASIFMNVNKEAIKIVESDFEKINELAIDSSTLKDILSRAKLLGHDTLIIKEGKIVTGRENGTELEDESETIIETQGKGELKLNIIDLLKLPVLDYNIKIYTGNDIILAVMYPLDYPEVRIVVSEKLS